MTTDTTAGAAAGELGRPMLCQDRPTRPESTREACAGRVDFREPLSGTGTPTIRCEHHWAKRLELQDRHRAAGYDSPTPPAWFDESYAGERWNED